MRYMLFAGRTYYPNGGMLDLEGCFESIEELSAFLLDDKEYDWGHIFDRHTYTKMELDFEYNENWIIKEVLVL